MEPGSVPLRGIELSENQTENRILLKSMLVEAVNIDTSLWIRGKSLSKEGYSAYVEYMDKAFRREEERGIKERSGKAANKAGMNRSEMMDELSDEYELYRVDRKDKAERAEEAEKMNQMDKAGITQSDRIGMHDGAPTNSLISVCFMERIDLYVECMMKILRYIRDNMDDSQNDLLFYSLMEVFEECIFCLGYSQSVHYAIFALAVSNDTRKEGFLSFLSSIVHSTDQRREIASGYISSFVREMAYVSDRSMDIIREYSDECISRIESVQDKFSSILLGGLLYMMDNPVIRLETERIVGLKKRVLPIEYEYQFRPTQIETYNRLIREIEEEGEKRQKERQKERQDEHMYRPER